VENQHQSVIQMSQKTPHTLYLCYFGLREPLVQTQVLPYLREIHKGGTKVSILTFETTPKENWTNQQIEAERDKLAAEGINWDFLTYHKRPSVPATIFDVLNGARFAINLNKKEKIDVYHARAHVAALMGAFAKARTGGKLLFDIRGFIPEEYTDAGIWKENGKLYHAVKRAEKYLLDKSDGFVVLTEKARGLLFPKSLEKGRDHKGRPVEVIPCCIDKDRFRETDGFNRETLRREYQLGNKTVFVYVGSFGGWYMSDELVNFFVHAHRRNPNSYTIVLTQREQEKIRNLLLNAGLNESDFTVQSVLPQDVPKYLKMADVALSLIRACYSKQASSPTKIAEYLASGLPVISNSGVGDLDTLIENEKVGVIVRGFEEKDYTDALEKIKLLTRDPDLRERCRRTAFEKFDLESVAGDRYRRIYQRLLNEEHN
jgi:glycosyltransferase involved in cell wall biosynthesis